MVAAPNICAIQSNPIPDSNPLEGQHLARHNHKCGAEFVRCPLGVFLELNVLRAQTIEIELSDKTAFPRARSKIDHSIKLDLLAPCTPDVRFLPPAITKQCAPIDQSIVGTFARFNITVSGSIGDTTKPWCR